MVLHLSAELVGFYKSKRINISYALSELAGYLSARSCSKIGEIPALESKKVEVEIEDSVAQELRDAFCGIDSIDEAAEIMLWSNFFTGGRL